MEAPAANGGELRNTLNYSVPLFLSELLKTFRSDIQTILLGATYAVASVGVLPSPTRST